MGGCMLEGPQNLGALGPCPLRWRRGLPPPQTRDSTQWLATQNAEYRLYWSNGTSKYTEIQLTSGYSRSLDAIGYPWLPNTIVNLDILVLLRFKRWHWSIYYPVYLAPPLMMLPLEFLGLQSQQIRTMAHQTVKKFDIIIILTLCITKTVIH